jgi:hypothetical protein
VKGDSERRRRRGELGEVLLQLGRGRHLEALRRREEHGSDELLHHFPSQRGSEEIDHSIWASLHSGIAHLDAVE